MNATHIRPDHWSCVLPSQQLQSPRPPLQLIEFRGNCRTQSESPFNYFIDRTPYLNDDHHDYPPMSLINRSQLRRDCLVHRKTRNL